MTFEKESNEEILHHNMFIDSTTIERMDIIRVE